MNPPMGRVFGNRTRFRRTVFFASSLAAALLALQARPQQKKSNPALQYEVSVVLKLVQVFASDAKGKPVTDLAVSDFELWDNGESKKITDFESPKPVVIPSEPGAEAAGAKPGLSATPATAGAAAPMLGRKFYLILDFFRNDGLGVKKAKSAALSFADKLLPTDQAAVFLFSANRGLVLCQPPTSDRKKIKTAVEKAKEAPYFWSLVADTPSATGPGGELHNPLPASDDRLTYEDSEEETDQAGKESSSDPGRVSGMSAQGATADLGRIILNFTSSMTELARTLRAEPGFKNVLFYSAGLSYALIYGRATSGYSGDLEIGSYPTDPMQFGAALMKNKTASLYREPFDRMIQEFSSANCPVYAVNTEGNRSLLNARNLRGMDSLKNFAAETGGRYFSDAEYREVIAESVENITRSYYVLGYPVRETWDGRYHEIKVKVKRPGVKVHAQRGYFSPKPFVELSDFEKRLQLLDLALSKEGQPRADGIVPTLALEVTSGSAANCLSMCAVPVGPVRNIAGSKAEVLQVILDQDFNVAASRRADVNITSMPEKDGCFYELFSLKPGTYLCRTVVRNLETGQAAVGSSPLTIHGPAGPGLSLTSPLLILPDKPACFVKISESAKGAPAQSIHDLFPLFNGQSEPVLDSLAATARTIQAQVRISAPNAALTDILVSGWLMNKKTGDSIRCEHKILATQPDREGLVVLIELQVPPLDPGDYDLGLAVQDRWSKVSATTSRALKIV